MTLLPLLSSKFFVHLQNLYTVSFVHISILFALDGFEYVGYQLRECHHVITCDAFVNHRNRLYIQTSSVWVERFLDNSRTTAHSSTGTLMCARTKLTPAVKVIRMPP